MTTLRMLIDGDLVLFQRMIAAESETDFGDDFWGFSCDHRQALQHVAADVVAYEGAIRASRPEWDDATIVPIMCFSSSSNWRKLVDPTYKENRKGKRKPCGWPAAIKSLSGLFTVEKRHQLEGDDVIGILATNPANSGKSIVISGDKDLRTVPGMHLDPTALEEGVFTVDAEHANWSWMMQTLTGDASDGYRGCPGVGQVKARKILGNPGDLSMGEMLDAVLAAYNGDACHMRDQSLLARILRHGDWDWTSNAPTKRIPSVAFAGGSSAEAF